MRVSRDAIVAVLLLAFCGVMWHASYGIELKNYASLQSTVWPRIILGALALFSALMLAAAIAKPRWADAETTTPTERDAGVLGWLLHYRNALIIYVLFLAFLLTLPKLGMLLGGGLFVFLSLTALGRPTPRLIGVHALVAVLAIGGMWAIFTFGLGVILPEGELIRL
ncbi:MAG: tripartite tricarboxylate transporter TctB family protein [Alphaproteobacteria bacterium]|nr:tripartite tricarboxylate transporter TctB family protein [Alphaproteobacteria bacterium]